jgi:hypothetical protein
MAPHFNPYCFPKNKDRCETSYLMLSCERVSFRVTSSRVTFILGQLSAARRIGGKRHFLKLLAAFSVMEPGVM